MLGLTLSSWAPRRLGSFHDNFRELHLRLLEIGPYVLNLFSTCGKSLSIPSQMTSLFKFLRAAANDGGTKGVELRCGHFGDRRDPILLSGSFT